jgi:ABC-type uncharacterized transport system permease subunit
MGNLWKQFEDLLPTKKQYIGQVSSINTSEKTCTVDLLGGGSLVVKGTDVVISNWYLVEEDTIKREVPALSYFSLTIY